jgi:radical SAM/Cys-rich protein
VTGPATDQGANGHDFNAVLARHEIAPLRREHPPRILQINVGKLCNQACHHCHVDAGPKRTEVMTRATAERVMELLEASADVRAVDLTGGAPELNPSFAFLVRGARGLGRSVTVRCNLTVLFVEGMEWLVDFYRENRIELVCSMPCYTEENVDQQRGKGVFAKSIEALRRLNTAGYGRELRLDLVYNPVGPALPPAQGELEERYREELRSRFAIEFSNLRTITNMPINRFAHQLQQWGRLSEYMGLLVNHFNPATVGGLMCRDLVSVSFDGRLFDCDFNQMLEIPVGARATIWDVGDLAALTGAPIATAPHCFGCTAGAGSSCSGAVV